MPHISRLRYESGIAPDGTCERSVELDNRDSALSGWAEALRGGSWDYELGARSVKSAVRKARTKDVDTWFRAGTAKDAMQVLGSDAANGTPGMLVLDGEWRQRALMLGDDVEQAYLDGSVKLKLTWALLDGFWTRSTDFGAQRSDVAASYVYLDPPFDAPYDLAPYVDDGAVEVPAGGPRASYPLTIRFQGPCSSPAAIIDGNRYEVDADVPYNGELVLDGPSLSAKMYVRGELYGDVTGRAVRGLGEGRGRYAFQPLERQGRSVVRLENCDRATVTVHEMRGEPPWR